MTQQTDCPQIDRGTVDYTGMSVKYDQVRFEGIQNKYHEMVRRRVVLRQAGNGNTNRKVLDVGCGTGRGLAYLASVGFRNMCALDYTYAMLEFARAKLHQQYDDDTTGFVRGNAFSLPFEPETFDLVISLNFLHLFRLEKQADVIRQLHRVCRPGGRVVVEFENLRKGILLGRQREQHEMQNTTKLNTIGELKQLFSDDLFESVRIMGSDLPAVHRLLKYVPRFGAAVETITHNAPLNRIASRLVVAAQRR